jgi:threonine/homoserine efflux transporter RhtA
LLALLPVAATAMGWIALHQHLEPAELVGVGCVVLGLALNGLTTEPAEPALSA